MKITARQLTQIIREELLREAETDAPAVKMAAASGNAADGPVHQVDREGKAVVEGAAVSGGLSFQLTVQGLSEPELKAMKKLYADDSNAKYFLTLENVSGQDVTFHMRIRPGNDERAGRIASGTGSQGFYALNEEDLEEYGRSVELGACLRGPSTSEQFWNSAFYLTMVKIGPQAKALVTGAEAYPAALIKFVVGTGKDIAGSAETGAAATKISLALPARITAAAVKKWQADVTKAPLRRGSQGPNVEIAQELLKAFFEGEGIIAITADTSTAAVKQAFVKAGLPPQDGNLQLGQLIDKMKPDSNMGPITSAAVFAFQQSAGKELAVDGTIGKDTAASLVDMFNMPADTSESIVRRWNKLAGLLVD